MSSLFVVGAYFLRVAVELSWQAGVVVRLRCLMEVTVAVTLGLVCQRLWF